MVRDQEWQPKNSSPPKKPGEPKIVWQPHPFYMQFGVVIGMRTTDGTNGLNASCAVKIDKFFSYVNNTPANAIITLLKLV